MAEENLTPENGAEISASGGIDVTGDLPDMVPRESVNNMHKALKTERGNRKDLERQVKEMQQQLERFAGKDPDEWDKIQAEAAETARQRMEMSEQRQMIEEKYGAQAAEASRKAEAAATALADYKKKYALEKVFYAAGGRTDADGGVSFFDLMAEKIGSSFRQEEDGSLTVIDAQGDPVLDQESGKRISPEDFIASYKTHSIYGTFFKGAKGAGAGIGFSGTDANGVVTEDWNQLSRTEMFQRAFGSK
jgi:hypothetical protein